MIIATETPDEAIIKREVPIPKLLKTVGYSISPIKGSKNIISNVAIDIGKALLIHKISAPAKSPQRQKKG